MQGKRRTCTRALPGRSTCNSRGYKYDLLREYTFIFPGLGIADSRPDAECCYARAGESRKVDLFAATVRRSPLCLSLVILTLSLLTYIFCFQPSIYTYRICEKTENMENMERKTENMEDSS